MPIFCIRTSPVKRRRWQYLSLQHAITDDRTQALRFDRETLAQRVADKAALAHPGRVWRIAPITAVINP